LVTANAWRHQVMVSSEGLTIHTPGRRPVVLDWKEIKEVHYSARLGVYRVLRKGGGVKWVWSNLDGQDCFHEYLDHFLWPADPSAVPAYLAALKHKNGYVRRGAALGLCKIGPPARQAVPDLIGALRDKVAVVRSWSAAALGAIGPEAWAASDALRRALADKDEDVRRAAGAALKEIEAVPTLA
jgi:hypothetical protein